MQITTGNTMQNPQALLQRFEEVDQIVHGLAQIILPRMGEFHSVQEITEEVLAHYYRAQAA